MSVMIEMMQMHTLRARAKAPHRIYSGKRQGRSIAAKVEAGPTLSRGIGRTERDCADHLAAETARELIW